MNTPPRTLRAWVEDAHGRPPPSARELDREDTILKKASTLFLRAGRHGLSLTTMGLALRMSPGTIRMAFCDLDNILFEILWRHLTRLRDAIAAIPEEASASIPGHTEARVRAYLEIARCGMGGLTESHTLLVRDRHGLPADLAEPIEDLRLQIGEMIAGQHAPLVLNMLDTPYVEAHRLLPMLQTLFATTAEAPTAEPPAATATTAPTISRPPALRGEIPEAARNFTLSGRPPIDLSGPSMSPGRIEDFLRTCEADACRMHAPPSPANQESAARPGKPNPAPAPRPAA